MKRIQGNETVYLPNREGHYKPVKLPKYIQDILSHTRNTNEEYTYKIVGVNPVRPAYGVEPDAEKLVKWASRYHSETKVKRISKQKKDYYATVWLTDPIANQLEKAGWL